MIWRKVLLSSLHRAWRSELVKQPMISQIVIIITYKIDCMHIVSSLIKRAGTGEKGF